MRKPKTKKDRAAAQRNGEILSVLCFFARMKVEESACFQVPARDYESCVQMLRQSIHAKWARDEEDYDRPRMDAFLDRVVADPSSFLPMVSLTARTAAAFNTYVEQTIKEKDLAEPIRERFEFGENEEWLHLEGANGKKASIRIYTVTLH